MNIQNILSLLENLPLRNFDLLTVGVTIAAIGILGFLIYINNRGSITNKSFLFFSIITILWSFFNYINYQLTQSDLVLWLLRIVIFLGVWHSFSFFQFFYVFPEEKKIFPNWYKFALVPYVIGVSILTLTPIVFSGIAQLSFDGSVSKTIVEKGIVLFVTTVIGLLLAGTVIFVRKILKAKHEEKVSYRLILAGTVITFTLLFTFNLILPAVFLNVRFMPLGALFIFPFIAFTSYAILKHKLFNVKVAATGLLIFTLAVISFLEIIFADELFQKLFSGGIFLFVLIIGNILIRSVLREVEQREKIEKLAWELSNTNAKLESANEKLKELDKQKTEFVSIAAHQLRSPLTAIKGYSSMLLEGSFGKVAIGKPRDAIQIIFESSNKLAGVIEDFLNITRIELGKMHYEMTTFDLAQMAQSVVNELKPNVERKGLSINFSSDPGPLNISGDTGKLSQVLSNVIDNAIKYTKTGGLEIKVTRRQEGNKSFIRFSSKDTGIGLDQETIAKLFEKFIRADGAGQINVTGTGLGLYVAKQIVEGNGGKIWAESEGKGKGSTFIVELEEVKSLDKATTK